MAKTHYMNPAYGKHVGQYGGDAEHESEYGSHMPHIAIHTGHDESGQPTHHIVHIHHHDGRHEMHEHAIGDTAGIAGHIEHHLNPNRAGGVHPGGAESTAEEGEENQWEHGE